MGDHLIEFTKTRQPSEKPEWAQCKCGANSGWQATRDITEKWAVGHREQVHIVKAALQRREPGLSDQHRYYLQMSEDPNTSREHRAQWLALAKELEPKVRTVDPHAGQERLFEV